MAPNTQTGYELTGVRGNGRLHLAPPTRKKLITLSRTNTGSYCAVSLTEDLNLVDEKNKMQWILLIKMLPRGQSYHSLYTRALPSYDKVYAAALRLSGLIYYRRLAYTCTYMYLSYAREIEDQRVGHLGVIESVVRCDATAVGRARLQYNIHRDRKLHRPNGVSCMQFEVVGVECKGLQPLKMQSAKKEMTGNNIRKIPREEKRGPKKCQAWGKGVKARLG